MLDLIYVSRICIHTYVRYIQIDTQQRTVELALCRCDKVVDLHNGFFDTMFSVLLFENIFAKMSFKCFIRSNAS